MAMSVAAVAAELDPARRGSRHIGANCWRHRSVFNARLWAPGPAPMGA
jgi:hypothetical protein